MKRKKWVGKKNREGEEQRSLGKGHVAASSEKAAREIFVQGVGKKVAVARWGQEEGTKRPGAEQKIKKIKSTYSHEGTFTRTQKKTKREKKRKNTDNLGGVKKWDCHELNGSAQQTGAGRDSSRTRKRKKSLIKTFPRKPTRRQGGGTTN